MNRKQLKELIKPLVQECVKETIQETLLTGGLLSQIVSEVVSGFAPVLTENTTKKTPTEKTSTQQEINIKEVFQKTKPLKNNNERQHLLSELGKTAYNGVNVFENVKETIPDEPGQSISEQASPFRDIDPSDPGVDITSFYNPIIANRLLQGKKRN
jgi:hypothetical protein